MAHLGEEIQFSPECLIKFFRLPIAFNGNNFVINSARNSISTVQAHDQKFLQTWTLRHPHSFTSPLAVCKDNNTVCCIMDNQTLMVWSNSADSLEGASKKRIKLPIFCVMTVSSVCVVVFGDGNVCSVDHALSQKEAFPSQSPILTPGSSLIWADSIQYEEQLLIAYVARNEKTSEHTLYSIQFDVDQSHVQVLKTEAIQRDKHSVLSWCLSSFNGVPSLLTIWNDGEIHAYNMLDGASKCILKISDISKNCKSTSISNLGKTHLAVVKGRTQKNDKATLEIWDLKYCVCKEVKVLKHKLPDHVQMQTFETSIFLSSTEGMSKIPLRLEDSTLSSALGRSVPSSNSEKKSYVWSAEGSTLCESPTPETKKFCIANITSKNFEKAMQNLSVEEAKRYCTELSQRKDIAEKEVVKMLKSVLMLKTKVSGNKDMEIHSDFLLNSIFRVSFTDIFLAEYLKMLGFDLTLEAIQFLMKTFTNQLAPEENDQVPSDSQIVSWLELLVHSHYDDFVMSKDKNVLKLLKNVQSALLEKIDLYSEYNDINSFLMFLKKKISLPEKSKHTKYCIEILQL